ncbi:uncharacterized protein C8Q71DRAFT_787710 [Rhodofomes roseus]|uniref:Secreted protein n=1 Tax=Rhodofomes roseus TaxID=34475 RepID=A0ABQ8K0L3_9APHY|nr:uncharacterized protein C8Q71DRAFT_787710 [Rhodofomes roseus]KAH9830195.1 hypothetical protein C8Q71DRAFT_787710 [Rhodofomes roseus]
MSKFQTPARGLSSLCILHLPWRTCSSLSHSHNYGSALRSGEREARAAIQRSQRLYYAKDCDSDAPRSDALGPASESPTGW